jgi:hypothetical protein
VVATAAVTSPLSYIFCKKLLRKIVNDMEKDCLAAVEKLIQESRSSHVYAGVIGTAGKSLVCYSSDLKRSFLALAFEVAEKRRS